jgi:flavin reductase (DIM6/NTAB) family NADH-FMN oxidoreductase RutF
MEVIMPNFKDLRIVDNFYQTSSFFPMPTILISTLDDEGNTSLGSYSLCFPYYVAGKDYYAMILSARNSSNTSQNLLKRPKCTLNFLPSNKKIFKETVRLGFPGDSSKDKMKNLKFTLIKGMAQNNDEEERPLIVSEAFQVFECTWVSELEDAFKDQPGNLEGYEPPYRQFNGITSKFGAHFILRIDKILMEEKFMNSIVNGVNNRNFPKIPVDYGYRDNTHFWYSSSNKYKKEPVPAPKEVDISTVRYAADRTDPNITFTDEACKRLSKVPRIFLKAALDGCAKWAKENNVNVIGEKEMDIINDKRSTEKNR